MTGFPKGQGYNPLSCLLPINHANNLSEVTFTFRTYDLSLLTHAAQEELAEQRGAAGALVATYAVSDCNWP